ncbi:AAA family ATPase [Streptomyces smaragdinus]|uniref:AAA family ATPase n=1 Tax=Streptomyces smaragdinus TaxID=2585196 RepID=UPI002B21AA28|nr:MoxR family ATPase [Streptomyces smaragdinus]
MSDWRIYRGAGRPHDGLGELPAPPPWRDFSRSRTDAGTAGDAARRLGVQRQLVESLHPRPQEVEAVNAALYLRRPLLVTGDPGTGKSTLAHAVAYELGLGKVLRWPIVSRSALQDGLYHYDAIGRLQDVQLDRAQSGGEPAERPSIGDYIRLGPLGTALLPVPEGEQRVLLVDELDKGDTDLPNDLLNVLEEGEFTIPELERAPEERVRVRTDDGGTAVVERGRVRCQAFPFIVLTSNGERTFPAALLRRCIPLELAPPDPQQLAAMVTAHLGPDALADGAELIEEFLRREPGEVIANDQLFNALFFTARAQGAEPATRRRIAEMLLHRLDRSR